ncbi:glycine cleavage system aminomethyltransferase GcvT [Balneolales bacterium ANBcel1]|nr:glycine cleavage system aminomethyltransferase GcvT [Balneolales bacterium ANBcel1]
MLKKTPLFEIHRQLKARLLDFSGFEMPLQYSGIKEEHFAVRRKAGIFDVSHMGEILIHGEKALEVVQDLSVNDAARLVPGKAQYSVMCREHGGIVDDLLVYCLSKEELMLVVNASNIEKDLNWIVEVNQGRAEISNISDEIALIALQGPEAAEILTSLTPDKPESIPSFEFRSMQISDYDNILVSATGYTGEPGFELYCNIRHVNACDLWENIMEAGESRGLQPCGLGARDTLRLEAGLPLYGNDLSEETTPLEAGLGWLISWEKEFRGKNELLIQKQNGVKRRLSALMMKEPGRIPRAGCSVVSETGEHLGEVTSGGLSMMHNRGIAMAYLDAGQCRTGDSVIVKIRNKGAEAEIVKRPFFKKK